MPGGDMLVSGMEIRLSSHGAYRTEYHVVFVTKYRRRILNPGVATYLGAVFPKATKIYPGVEIVTHNVQADHVHMVMIIPPKYACADVLGRTKQITASLLRKKFMWLDDVYRNEIELR
jgi:putative transposase